MPEFDTGLLSRYRLPLRSARLFAEDASGNLFVTSYNFQIPTLRK